MSLVFEVSSNALVKDVLSPLIRVSSLLFKVSSKVLIIQGIQQGPYYSRYPAVSLLFRVSTNVLINQGL